MSTAQASITASDLPTDAAVAAATVKLPAFRWTVCALLFAATTINYMDRQILGLLAPALQKEIGWNEEQYGHIVVAFQAAYAIGLFCIGRLIDSLGTRKGYAWAIVVWSLAAAAHALARTATGFGVARFALGLGEAGNFPSAIKTVAEWFPKRERAFATGLFNSGSNIGAILAPLIVPFLADFVGWRGAFVAMGAVGLIWLAFWLTLYRRPEDSPHVTPEQLALLQEGEPQTVGQIAATAAVVETEAKTLDYATPPTPPTPVSWGRLLKFPQSWGLILQSMCVQPVWWFYLYWLPKFFNNRYGLALNKSAGLLAIIYGLSLIGSVGGGWLPNVFLSRGYSLNFSRKAALLLCVVLILPMTLVIRVDNPWTATVLIGFAAAALQGWSANTYTITSDLFPKRVVATMVGLGSACGSIAAMVFAEVVGQTLQNTGSYAIPFLIAGLSLPAAWTFIHVFAPRYEPAEI